VNEHRSGSHGGPREESFSFLERKKKRLKPNGRLKLSMLTDLLLRERVRCITTTNRCFDGDTRPFWPDLVR
jgi:hypothetical protein